MERKKFQNYEKFDFNKGSEALDYDLIELDEIEQRKIYKTPTRKRVIREPINPNVKAKYSSVDKINAKSQIIVVCVIFSIFAMLFMSINIRSQIVVARNTYNENSEILIKNNNTIQELQVELAQSYDIQEIERIATEELKMSKPASYQIIYIDPVNENYVEYNQIENVESDSILDKLKELLNG